MDAPRVLLEHYLKQLRLPAVLREFPKLADQCAKEGATFEQFLVALSRAGDAGPGTARHRAADQSGEVSGEQEPGDV
jgi:hypothetical protein